MLRPYITTTNNTNTNTNNTNHTNNNNNLAAVGSGDLDTIAGQERHEVVPRQLLAAVVPHPVDIT